MKTRMKKKRESQVNRGRLNQVPSFYLFVQYKVCQNGDYSSNGHYNLWANYRHFVLNLQATSVRLNEIETLTTEEKGDSIGIVK